MLRGIPAYPDTAASTPLTTPLNTVKQAASKIGWAGRGKTWLTRRCETDGAVGSSETDAACTWVCGVPHGRSSVVRVHMDGEPARLQRGSGGPADGVGVVTLQLDALRRQPIQIGSVHLSYAVRLADDHPHDLLLRRPVLRALGRLGVELLPYDNLCCPSLQRGSTRAVRGGGKSTVVVS